VISGLSKNFFSVMQFRWPKAIAACVLLAFFNWLPFLGVWLAPGWSRAGYVVALLCIFLVYVGAWQHSGTSPLYFFLHPLATLLFMYTLARSMWLTLRQGGVEWRGTFYPIEELRRGLV